MAAILLISRTKFIMLIFPILFNFSKYLIWANMYQPSCRIQGPLKILILWILPFSSQKFTPYYELRSWSHYFIIIQFFIDPCSLLYLVTYTSHKYLNSQSWKSKHQKIKTWLFNCDLFKKISVNMFQKKSNFLFKQMKVILQDNIVMNHQ